MRSANSLTRAVSNTCLLGKGLLRMRIIDPFSYYFSILQSISIPGVVIKPGMGNEEMGNEEMEK